MPLMLGVSLQMGNRVDNKDIAIPIEGILSFEDFVVRLNRLTESEGATDKAADLYDKIPTYMKALTNLDPTGVSGMIDQALSENRSRRENDNIAKALYALYSAMAFLGSKQLILEDAIKRQIPDLTRLYFEKAKDVYDSSKIQYFKNVWLNGLLSKGQGVRV